MAVYYDTLIVGTGHAGTQLAVSLHNGGYTGTVGLVGSETELPYERPPLSKGYMSGEQDDDEILIRSQSFWDESGIDLRLGEEVTEVDAGSSTTTTRGGEHIGFGTLVWAAGGTARRIPVPGSNLRGVRSLRTIADARLLRHSANSVRRLAVIGGGYIGLEAAAKFTELGVQVTVVEALPRLLARVTGQEISDYIAQLHENHGVRIILNSGVEEITGSKGHVTGVRLASGEHVPADLVLVGIGLIPSCRTLQEAGAAVDNGIVTDAFCHSTLPNIYAIGDCANTPSKYAQTGRVRLESVQNATDQAKTVAAAILGDARPYTAPPWFWSHQYDTKIQTAGLQTGHETTIIRGNPAESRFSVIYLKENEVLAVDAVNMMRDYVQGRNLVERGARIDANLAKDPDVPLKDTVVNTAHSAVIPA
ncbi:NAD(P)/FAD-dependent oxidoreductase [Arthrobacter sp. AZCC_0090]|uniref:NAD(P)/FAD-dependent oxidoreductase n=1 Tax=Arthrobacter sp. AZCC_0090 TaxID=2735881 RepID=UPI00161BD3AD|nr:FAD-dependent oxidoreductase [Arthrobacter sp. AZCC_0090]MBB6407154.1 3-phenylpropionate/trans-cinnamate dioxygenase ferredoxin reductase subunit [Arthrobacter sp. AZCC_0090]